MRMKKLSFQKEVFFLLGFWRHANECFEEKHTKTQQQPRWHIVFVNDSRMMNYISIDTKLEKDTVKRLSNSKRNCSYLATLKNQKCVKYSNSQIHRWMFFAMAIWQTWILQWQAFTGWKFVMRKYLQTWKFDDLMLFT